MLQNYCMRCGSAEVVDATLNSDRVHVVSRVGWNASVPLQCMACLECGFVATYLNRDDREKVRSWNGKEDER